MASHFRNPGCDCGSCCDLCNDHEPGCALFDAPPPVLSAVELRQIADERPDSLLASLMSDVTMADAAYIDLVYGGER